MDPAQAGVLRHSRAATRGLRPRRPWWRLLQRTLAVIDATLPPEVALHTIYARACDPVPAFLKAAGQHSNAQIVGWVLSTCRHGPARPAAR